MSEGGCSSANSEAVTRPLLRRMISSGALNAMAQARFATRPLPKACRPKSWKFARDARGKVLSSDRPNNGMHPTADTSLVVNLRGAARRVMPAFGGLSRITEVRGWRAASRAGEKQSRLARGARCDSLVLAGVAGRVGGALRVASAWRRPRTSQCTRPPTRVMSS